MYRVFFTSVTLACAVALYIGITGTLSHAQVDASLFRGGGSGGVYQEPKFRFRTTRRNHAAVNVDRSVLVVPESYGEPFAITNAGTQQMIWYKDSKNRLRNVLIRNQQALVVTTQQPGSTTKPQPGSPRADKPKSNSPRTR